jgi:hypothetical protein
MRFSNIVVLFFAALLLSCLLTGMLFGQAVEGMLLGTVSAAASCWSPVTPKLQCSCVFRGKLAVDSDGSWPPIPE